MNNENNLNIIRFSLAYIVFISHFIFLNNIPFHNIIFEELATLAVNTFFLISGLLITRSYLRRKSIIDFYKKRVLRIFPAYYLMLFVLLIFTFIKSNAISFNNETFSYFFYNSIFLNFMNPVNPYLFIENFSNITNGSLWTIKIEICLYLITPLLLKGINRNLSKFLFLIILSSVWFIYFSNHENNLLKSLAVQFPGQLRFFLTGSLIYLYFEKIKIDLLKIIILIFIACVTYIYMRFLFILFQPLVLGGIIVYFGLKMKKISYIKSDVSYGFYLFHFPIIQFFISKNNYELSLAYIFLIETFVIFVFSFCSWNLIEKKLLKQKKHQI